MRCYIPSDDALGIDVEFVFFQDPRELQDRKRSTFEL